MSPYKSKLIKKSSRGRHYPRDINAEFEKIQQQHLHIFEERLHNIATDIAHNMQKKIMTEISQKLSEQMLNSLGNGVLNDVLGKTLQQTLTSLGNHFTKL